VAVFKAHITTGPGGKVMDMFWLYDNRCELPENHRRAAELLPEPGRDGRAARPRGRPCAVVCGARPSAVPLPGSTPGLSPYGAAQRPVWAACRHAPLCLLWWRARLHAGSCAAEP